MKSDEVRQKFLNFFSAKGGPASGGEHKIVSSSSLIPSDQSVLFTTAGMQQFKPYFLGAADAKNDFGSLNVTSIQRSMRTSDIEEVGDESHLTFFEMLGNFSFGGYWKKEAIQYAHDFITEELGLTIDYVTTFGGDEKTPADKESAEIWRSLGIRDIRQAGREDNFWGPTGEEGPCGPTTEIFARLAEADGQAQVGGIEIWNIVFNEYYCDKDKKLSPLKVKGIDTGMGLERLLAVLQKKNTVYETDLFKPIISKIRNLEVEPPSSFGGSTSKLADQVARAERIVADHMRASVFLISDGITPSNTDRGYILRRLIRRAARYADLLGIQEQNLADISEVIAEQYKETSPEILKNLRMIKKVINEEEKRFRTTLGKGLKEFEKGTDAFTLFSTYGFPLELTLELAKEKGVKVNIRDFEEKFKKHQEDSRTASAGKFKGGLADQRAETVKLHTAHHLLLAALQKILGKEVKQRGSNITSERLRLDFSFERKLTDEEKQRVEKQVNQWIEAGLEVIRKEMKKEEAEKIGAEMEFGVKYPDMVSVYFIQDKEGNVISKEFCGGPHVKNTSGLGKFKIKKEEAVAAGVRRIKGVLNYRV